MTYDNKDMIEKQAKEQKERAEAEAKKKAEEKPAM
jgi:hypothetical protein